MDDKRKKAVKLLATVILLIFIDRIEFAYAPFEGSKITVDLPFYEEDPEHPIYLSWFVYLESIQVQHFLWTLLAWMWLPMAKDFKWVVIAFGLCVIELPLTYGEPIAKLPLPWQWYFPLSCSLLRLGAVLYYFTRVVFKLLRHEAD